MALVNAKCTNCGGILDVDSSKDAAICPYCKSAYIVKDAINIYNHFSSGQEDLSVLLKRASDFKSIGKISDAQSVYNQITMLFPLCAEAWFELGKLKITDLLFPNSERMIDWREFHGCYSKSDAEKKIRNKYKHKKSLEMILSDVKYYIETSTEMNTARKIWGDFKFNSYVEMFNNEIENKYKLLEEKYENEANLIIKESNEIMKKCSQDVSVLDGYDDPDKDIMLALIEGSLYYISLSKYYKFTGASINNLYFKHAYSYSFYPSDLNSISLTMIYADKYKLILHNGKYATCLYKCSSYSKERHIQRLKELEKRELQWKNNKCCSYCGGWYNGLFSKKCSMCGLPKNY